MPAFVKPDFIQPDVVFPVSEGYQTRERQNEALLSFPMPRDVDQPSGLALVCYIAILLGSLGIISSLCGIIAMSRLQNPTVAPARSGVPDGYYKAQLELMTKLQGVQERFLEVNTGVLATNASLSVCLIAAGIMCMQFQFTGHSLLLWTFGFVVAFETARLIAYGLMANNVLAILSTMAVDIQSRGFGSGIRDSLAALDAVKYYALLSRIGCSIMATFAIGEIVFCILGFRYLRKPDIRELFPEPT